MDRIQELEQKIASLKQGTNITKDSVWAVLDEKTKDLTEAEAAAISAKEPVKAAQADMMDAFIKFYLFAKYREEFVSVPTFRPLCVKYISAVMAAKEEGIKNTIALEEENRKLKEELERLRNGSKTN